MVVLVELELENQLVGFIEAHPGAKATASIRAKLDRFFEVVVRWFIRFALNQALGSYGFYTLRFYR